jgi:N-acetylmuramoyl-L-alanine amidase
MPKVILDAGHGGRDVGEFYLGRAEKDDNLKLALAVGNKLAERGIDVAYTRTTDTYIPMLERVKIINEIGGDLMVSLHRISSDYKSSIPILDFFLLNEGGLAEKAAINIAKELSETSFENNGILLRTDVPVLSQIDMPGIMMGLGNIQSEADNMLFDRHLDDIAEAIADGIADTLKTESKELETKEEKKSCDRTNIMEEIEIQTKKEEADHFKEEPVQPTPENVIKVPVEKIPQESPSNGQKSPAQESPVQESSSCYRYKVQVGLFRTCNNARSFQMQCLYQGFSAEINKQGILYAVLIGDYTTLDEAVVLHNFLKQIGYDTLLVAV